MARAAGCCAQSPAMIRLNSSVRACGGGPPCRAARVFRNIRQAVCMKIGLALGSGSARGWSHIGVIEALAERGIHPEVVCGTSIGSLVGAAYAGGSLECLKERVCALNKLHTATYFTFGVGAGGLVNRDKLDALFVDCVAAPGALIEELPIRYAAVAAEMATGREYWLKKGPILPAIWASISLPGLFPPVRYHNRWLFDGGLVNPVPISVCRALGAEMVIAVNLNGELIGRHGTRKKKAEGEGDFVDRIAATFRHYGTPFFSAEEASSRACSGRWPAPSILYRTASPAAAWRAIRRTSSLRPGSDTSACWNSTRPRKPSARAAPALRGCFPSSSPSSSERAGSGVACCTWHLV